MSPGAYCPPECSFGTARREEKKEGLLLGSQGTGRPSRKFKGGAGLECHNKEFIFRWQEWLVFVAAAFKARSHVSQTGFEIVILQSLVLKCWYYRSVTLCVTSFVVFLSS